MKGIERRRPNVFLIGEAVQGSSLLASLEKRGCECSFATSSREAFLILRNLEFDLLLSPMRLRDDTLYPIMSLLEGSGTTMFYSYAVEHGCWWLPALQRGQKCFGSAALRGREFIILLDEMIKQIQRETLAAERQPLLIVRASSSVVPVPPQGVEQVWASRASAEERVKRKAAGRNNLVG